MGWQESRVSLIPTNSDIIVEITRVGHQRNVPEIFSFQTEGSREHSVHLVHGWLNERGFQLSDEVGKDAVILRKNDVELTLFGVENQLSEITATFTLSTETRIRCISWEELVAELCERFDLVLFDADLKMKTSAESLLRILSNTRSWQDLKVPYHLPELDM